MMPSAAGRLYRGPLGVLRYEFSITEVESCGTLAALREASAKDRQITERWTRSRTRSGLDLMKLGAMGELATRRLWGLPASEMRRGPDPGRDLVFWGMKINARGRATVRGGSAPDLVLNVHTGPSEWAKADAFVLLWVHKASDGWPVADFMGFQFSDWLANASRFLPTCKIGPWESWVFPRHQMVPVECFETHATELGDWSDVARAAKLA